MNSSRRLDTTEIEKFFADLRVEYGFYTSVTGKPVEPHNAAVVWVKSYPTINDIIMIDGVEYVRISFLTCLPAKHNPFMILKALKDSAFITQVDYNEAYNAIRARWVYTFDEEQALLLGLAANTTRMVATDSGHFDPVTVTVSVAGNDTSVDLPAIMLQALLTWGLLTKDESGNLTLTEAGWEQFHLNRQQVSHALKLFALSLAGEIDTLHEVARVAMAKAQSMAQASLTIMTWR